MSFNGRILYLASSLPGMQETFWRPDRVERDERNYEMVPSAVH